MKIITVQSLDRNCERICDACEAETLETFKKLRDENQRLIKKNESLKHSNRSLRKTIEELKLTK